MGGPMRGGAVREDPLPVSLFYLEVQGKFEEALVFREVTGIGSTTEVIPYKAARKNDYHTIQMVPGRLQWTEVVCKRGITSAMDAWKWRKEVEEGKVESARANASLVMVGQDGTELARWNFERCWPTAITGPVMNSTQNDVGLEELKFTHERMERVK
jgi:phage tail-like protein